MQKKLVAGIIIGLVIAGAAITTAFAQANTQKDTLCASETIFEKFSKESSLGQEITYGVSGVHLSDEGTMAYLYDDFSTYAGNQLLIDGFEDLSSWSASIGALQFTNEHYEGTGSLSYAVPSEFGKEITLSKAVTLNANKWSDVGYITMWIKTSNANGIDSVSIIFEDEFGNKRHYAPLENVHASVPNTFGNDPEYPDLIYPEGDPKREMWVDFVLGSGWNYLLWRSDMYEDSGNTDMSNIRRVYLHLQTNEKLAGHTLIFDDLRIQDGLQRSSNPTSGMWYPPHGRPQYGVYDIDPKQGGTGHDLHLLNVRNTQYPSNGDHARMISASPTPMDFVMRVKFTMTQLGHEDETFVIPSPFPAWTPQNMREVQISDGGRDNTYFRVTYDFEPSWDPGHEWFGAYLSLQYNRFGILSVWPVERNVLQDQEPSAGARTATTEFIPEDGVQYEMQLLAKGQFASATIYEVKDDDCLERKAGTSYTFERQRHGPDKRYPLAIESTGNMRSLIHEVELVSLERVASERN